WRAAPPDALDFLALNEPAANLWLYAEVQGDGAASPVLHQVRVEYDRAGGLPYLPAPYSRDGTSPVFLGRALAAFQAALEAAGRLIDDLPLLFDPRAAPAGGAPASWLDWLATWLDFELVETWAEGQKRQALAGAFALGAWRGTAEGLRRLIAL